MPITPEMLARARQHRRAESEQLLAQMYAPVFRMTRALIGGSSPAEHAVMRIMRRALAHVEKWRDDTDAQRWFLHFTTLEVRRAIDAAPVDPSHDLLLLHGPRDNIAYVAFIRALRALPVQQLEAIVLHHAAHLNDRYVAIAMDCSTAAAEAHLKAAEGTLKAIAGPALPDRLAELSTAYRSLGPDAEIMPREVRAVVARDLRNRRAKKLAKVAIILGVIALIAGIAWWWRTQSQ